MESQVKLQRVINNNTIISNYLPNNYQKIDLIIGIQDLVIGAPYDGEDHRGAIYIYLGTPDGISQTHSQVLIIFTGTLSFIAQPISLKAYLVGLAVSEAPK